LVFAANVPDLVKAVHFALDPMGHSLDDGGQSGQHEFTLLEAEAPDRGACFHDVSNEKGVTLVQLSALSAV